MQAYSTLEIFNYCFLHFVYLHLNCQIWINSSKGLLRYSNLKHVVFIKGLRDIWFYFISSSYKGWVKKLTVGNYVPNLCNWLKITSYYTYMIISIQVTSIPAYTVLWKIKSKHMVVIFIFHQKMKKDDIFIIFVSNPSLNLD